MGFITKLICVLKDKVQFIQEVEGCEGSFFDVDVEGY